MASFRVARRAFCAAAEASPPPGPVSRWERLKNSKAGVWCRSLLSDYKEACKEIVVGARDRPLKASVYMGLLGGAYACFTTKPDQSSFQAVLLDRSNRLALLSPWIRNAGSDLHVQNLVKLRNQGCLRHLSLGLFSLVYSADFDPDSALYEASCSNLSVPWRELPERVLDFGFIGRWWVLEKKMEDFDVNETEYKHLPAHMQATAPPSVQEVERNERLHKESWLPPPVPEEEKPERTGNGEGTTTDAQDHASVSETGQVTETEDLSLDRPVVETLDTDVVHDVVETLDLKADGEVMERVDANVDSQVLETLEPQVDSQVLETLDLQVDSQVLETLEPQVDSQVLETLDLKVDSQVLETLEPQLDSQVLETLEPQMDSQVLETLDLEVDSQVLETFDLKVDSVVGGSLDEQVDSNEALNVEQQVTSGDIKEDPVVVDTHVDSQKEETVDPGVSVDRQEDNVEVVVEVVEPVLHNTTREETV